MLRAKMNNQKEGRRTFWLALLLLMAGLIYGNAAQKLSWRGTISKEGDVVVIKNPKEAISKDPVLSLREDFTIGGAAANPDQSFSEIRQLLVDGNGFIYILDTKESQIKVFDSTGKFIRKFGKKGQGPGEINLPLEMSFLRPKNEIAVLDNSRRISFFTLDGDFQRVVSTTKIWALRFRIDSAGNFYMTEGLIDPPNSWYIHRKFDENMNLLFEVGRSPAPTPLAFNPFMAISSWVLDENDNVIYGYPKTYEIQWISPQNKLFKKILKDYDPVEVSKTDTADYAKTVGEGMKAAFSSHHSAYRSFTVDDEGRLFVETWKMTEDNKNYFYDIFDGEGRYLSTMAFKGRPRVWKRGKLYSIDEDEDGYPVVRRSSVIWLARQER
jgi:hypothetical protein